MKPRRMTLMIAILVPFCAGAQTDDPREKSPSGDTIVVTGSRVTDESVSDFVEALTVETSSDQLAAFDAPICPKSMGLPDSFNQVIEDRIRDVAEQTGIEVARGDCRPNVTLLVAEDGAKLISRLRATHPDLFAGRDAFMNRRLVEQEGPVRAWQVLESRGFDGRPARRVRFLDLRAFFPRNPSMGTVYLPRGEYVDGVVPSRITRSTRQDLSLSFVVIDVAAMDGLSLAQVAEYTAMRTLAQTDPGDAAATGQPTILRLFDDRAPGNAAAGGITEWDKAFLKSLYETRRTVSAGLQRSNMARIVREELEADKPNP